MPPVVSELSNYRRELERDVESSRLQLQARHALRLVSDEYVEAGRHEATVREGTRQLAEVDDRIKRGLVQACDQCPDNRTCPVRMA